MSNFPYYTQFTVSVIIIILRRLFNKKDTQYLLSIYKLTINIAGGIK